jgi:hypothetical protein
MTILPLLSTSNAMLPFSDAGPAKIMATRPPIRVRKPTGAAAGRLDWGIGYRADV